MEELLREAMRLKTTLLVPSSTNQGLRKSGSVPVTGLGLMSAISKALYKADETTSLLHV